MLARRPDQVVPLGRNPEQGLRPSGVYAGHRRPRMGFVKGALMAVREASTGRLYVNINGLLWESVPLRTL
ncbi:hypothetical protein GCM10009544_49030 [Streptomyces stramineus]|uniref:Uncharacterized protein n=1 Tax=Streptomyces stramineus TaxID=173861 RepID=A0ABN1AQA2_9ACTN